MKNILKNIPSLAVAGALSLMSTQVQAAYYDPYCGTNAAVCCNDGCSNNFWAGAEYLYWQIQDSPESAPLVIEGPFPYVTPPVLDEPGTAVVLGGKKIENKWRSGGRFTLGYWFETSHCLGIEGNYFFLPHESKSHSVSSDGLAGSTLLRIPYVNVVTDQEASTGLAKPGVYAGTGTLKLNNRMQGAELNVLGRLQDWCGFEVTALAGFRYWSFYEGLTFNTSSPFVNPPVDVWMTEDKFDVENNLYAGQVGLILTYNVCNFFMNIKGKVAVGAMYNDLKIAGHLKTNDFDNFEEVVTYEGGYFTAPSNIGRKKQTTFSVLPEIDVNFGYKFCDCVTLQIGYTGIYVTNVLWAGKQIDRHLNTTQMTAYSQNTNPVLVGKKAPKARLKTEGLWVQGVSVGLGYEF